MKLRNLMYATMIACAFASCSKDDVTTPDDGTDAGLGDANFSISVSLADGDTKAASDVNAITGETTINDIQVAIYDGDTFLASATSSESATNKASFRGLPAGTFTCIVLANMPAGTIANITPAVLKAKTLAIPAAGFVSNSIPMYAQESITLHAGDNDDVLVSVVRNVARIQVSAIKMDMSQSDYSEGTAQFDLKNISLDNVAATGFITGDVNPEDGYVYGMAGYVSGAQSLAYYLKTISNASFTVKQEHFTKQTTAVSMPGLMSETSVPTYYFYAFPNANANNKTVLTISGKYSATNCVLADGTGTVNTPAADSYYPITIGLDGVVSDAKAEVVKNKVYDIQLSIAGAGFGKPGPDPDKKANFTIVATAANWASVVNQAPVIK